MNENIYKSLLIIIITLVSLYVTNSNKKDIIKEDFITWFQPFYKDNTKLVPKYMRDNIVYNNFKFDFLNKININIQSSGDIETVSSYNKNLFKNLMNNVKINNIYLNYDKDADNIYNKVTNNKNNIGIVSAVSIYNKISSEEASELSNINFITVTSYNYIFFLTNKTSNITNFRELNNKTINIGKKGSDSYKFGESIINNTKRMIQGEFNVKTTNYENEEAFIKLKNNEINAVVICDFFPNVEIQKLIFNDLQKEILLLPINFLNEDLFMNRHPYAKKVVLDLNLIESYLPKKIGMEKDSLYYTRFKPDLETYKYPRYMICNKYTYPNITYNITRSFYRNLNIINNDKNFIKNRNNIIYPIDLARAYVIPIHIGSYLMYVELGLITKKSSKYCAYFAGKDKCSDENIIRARLITE